MNHTDKNIVQYKPLPGDFAIWVFIFAELLVFGILFISYAFTRKYNLELFNHHQQFLDRETGAINTVLLITSSYFVVRAVDAIKKNMSQQSARWLALGLLCGAAFVVFKILEFNEKFSEGITLSTNIFYMFYLCLTGFHFMHVLLGMVILAFILVKTHRRKYNADDHDGVETGASYWHMVDLVWIILFPLVYIIR
ncbi:MAG: cytochrome c oxidase subunit 3 family protein [Pseudomonadales bacterium]|nr:cytochrome c oxidase subunit 3 family protein [Pseudomonadales bacterium]